MLKMVRWQALTGSRYPEELADRAWDNVGLLVGTLEEGQEQSPKVMVVNDLTWQVAIEAIEQNVSVIVSYRKLPILLRDLFQSV